MEINITLEESKQTFDTQFGEVNNISDGGFERGYEQGYGKGYADGELVSFDKGFEDGKKAQQDEFWDIFQDNGTRTNYDYAFAGWTEDIFFPKHDIICSSINSMFLRFGKNPFDLVERLAECGVVLDTSKASTFTNMFNQTKFTRIGTINTTKASSLGYLFSYSYSLKTIEKLILKNDGTQNMSVGTFDSCSALENLTIEGTIGKNNFTVQACKKLTHSSLISIINALQDKTTDTSGTTWLVTLGSDNLAKLTEDEKLLITDKGWTYK